MVNSLLASELFGRIHEVRCEGDKECHWCSAKCTTLWLHDDPPPIPFARTLSHARRINSPYQCAACWLYRRKRTTIYFVEGDFKDGQAISDYSWILINNQCLAIKSPCPQLYKYLLKPSNCFSLSLIDGIRSNLIQFAVVNDLPEIKDNTPLAFTVNGVLHHYTTHELNEVLKTGDPNGKDPGVQALWRILGPSKIYLVIQEDEKRDRGRPKKEELRSLGKTVRLSGIN